MSYQTSLSHDCLVYNSCHRSDLSHRLAHLFLYIYSFVLLIHRDKMKISQLAPGSFGDLSYQLFVHFSCNLFLLMGFRSCCHYAILHEPLDNSMTHWSFDSKNDLKYPGAPMNVWWLEILCPMVHLIEATSRLLTIYASHLLNYPTFLVEEGQLIQVKSIFSYHPTFFQTLAFTIKQWLITQLCLKKN